MSGRARFLGRRGCGSLSGRLRSRGLTRTIGMLLVASLACTAISSAQSTGFPREMIAAAALRPATLPLAATSADLAPARRFSSRAPGATLMIIGASAVVAGILVGGSGGTLLIVGGIGVGAYGVYLYTQ